MYLHILEKRYLENYLKILTEKIPETEAINLSALSFKVKNH